MISVGTAQASTGALYTPTLADISRNASVISSSSSSSSTSSLALNAPPVRPRPVRTFSSPRNDSPATASRNNSRPPAYLTGDVGFNDGSPNLSVEAKRDAARARSQSRNRSINGRLTAEDFEFGEELGEGSYSTVKRATLYTTGQEYAIKILDKGHLKRYGKLDTALAEKNTLVRLGSGHPGIVRLHSTFQDDWSLFFVLDLARNGEMQSRISRLGSLSTECTRYYSAQIVDALEYMHMKDVIHRDLKPENLLLDDDFRIKITDFGTGKLLGPGVQTAKTFVGTSQYVSPELLEANETSKSSDLWALGCIIYQMMAGRFTFTGLSDYLTWQKIKQVEYSFPDGFDEQAKDLVQKLIVRDPSQRLGAGGPGTDLSMQALREHPFFSTINWKTLWTEPAPPLEAGLVKREHPVAGHDQDWEDVGATWDDIAGDSDEDDSTDGIQWADDAVGPSYITGGGKVVELNGQSAVEEGPVGDIATYRRSPLRMERHEEEDAETVMGQESPPIGTTPPSETVTDIGGTEPIPVPSARAGTGSSGSSSEGGSPMEKLGAALESMKMSRGRNRVPTPLQGNGVQPIDWTSVLLPDEKIVFSGPVEERALRRRASRLIPIQVSPLKPKNRQLILTNHRLVCVKQRDRGVISVKHELLVQAPKIVSAKDKNHIVGIEAKASKEFVVMTSGKSQTYAVPDAEVASSWIDQIRAIFESKQPVQQT